MREDLVRGGQVAGWLAAHGRPGFALLGLCEKGVPIGS